jgi:hypothetical protein
MAKIIDIETLRAIHNAIKGGNTVESFTEVEDSPVRAGMLEVLTEDECDKLMGALRTAREKSKNQYAITYIDAVPRAYHEYGVEGVRVQILYILGNLRPWRGTEAKTVRQTLMTIETRLKNNEED